MDLPIEQIIPDIIAKLATSNRLIIQAEPGAGKTTVVPLKLMGQSWATGKILVLEPRRLAAVSSARRMSSTLGESVGKTVGYRVRLDTKVSDSTKIEIITEGIFIRMIQNDPELSGINAVIFDEFHERSLDADLGLALAIDCQENLRDDLKIILMSATIDGERLAEKLSCDTVKSQGRSFPVEIRWNPPRDREWLVDHTVRTIRELVRSESGSILAFLPGMGEIVQVETKLRESGFDPSIKICPLYGTLSRENQDEAIAPAKAGTRKIVLATNIAETSITIDGITAVVDSGVHREPKFDPGSGMTRLIVSPISRASADQRAGRAGRTAPGIAVRLWSEQSHAGRQPFHKPEILSAELSSFLLELALWGTTDLNSLFLFDLPHPAVQNESKSLLVMLGALDFNYKISKLGNSQSARDLAAILSERDFMKPKDRFEQADLALRIGQIERFRRGETLHEAGFTIDRSAVKRIVELADSWRNVGANSICPENGGDRKLPVHIGSLLALAFPDRIGMKRTGQASKYLLSGGGGASLCETDPLAKAEFVVVAECSGRDRDAKIFLAAEISRAEIESLFENQLKPKRELFWSDRDEKVLARETVRLGELIFSEKRIDNADKSQMVSAVISGIRSMGIDSLNWSDEASEFRDRLAFLHRHFPDQFDPVDEETLLATLEMWLAPYLNGITRKDQFGKIDLLSALRSPFDWNRLAEIDRLAPTRMVVPEGSHMKIDYSVEPPVLAVKLQMMFGSTVTPAVGAGTVPLTIHLLSPAGRPVQITQDLIGFWDGSYDLVKKEMKGRYPRHPWPDNPREAVATAKTTKRFNETKQ